VRTLALQEPPQVACRLSRYGQKKNYARKEGVYE